MAGSRPAIDTRELSSYPRCCSAHVPRLTLCSSSRRQGAALDAPPLCALLGAGVAQVPAVLQLDGSCAGGRDAQHTCRGHWGPIPALPSLPPRAATWQVGEMRSLLDVWERLQPVAALELLDAKFAGIHAVARTHDQRRGADCVLRSSPRCGQTWPSDRTPCAASRASLMLSSPSTCSSSCRSQTMT
jgi:hypothetical protein